VFAQSGFDVGWVDVRSRSSIARARRSRRASETRREGEAHGPDRDAAMGRLPPSRRRSVSDVDYVVEAIVENAEANGRCSRASTRIVEGT